MTKKLEAIEIYTKIMELVKEQDFHESNVALNFVRSKIENDYYTKQQVNNQYYGVSLLGAGASTNSCVSMADVAAKVEASKQQD